MSTTNYISKVVSDATAALEGLEDNMTVMFGGFGLCGIPENSIAAIREKAPRASLASPTMPGWMISALDCSCTRDKSKR
jgi:acyl CoA:acetate/3-ketoacid CoA transferase alpha subunit